MNTVSARARRVLMVGPYPPPEGGWATALREEREALERRGIECAVLNLGANRRTACGDSMPVRGAFDLIRQLVLHSSRRYLFRLHMNGDSPKGIAIVLLGEAVSVFSGRRPCLSFHAGINQRHFPDRGKAWLRILWKTVFGLSGTVICDCEEVRSLITRYRKASDVFAISPFSPRRVRYRESAIPVDIERFAALHRPLLFTYVAYRPEYEIEILLEALAIVRRTVPGLGCVVVDDRTFPDEQIVARISGGIGSRGLADAIAFTGHLDRDTFLTLLSRSDLFVRTPTTDGVCSSVLEALYLGVPVVAVDNGCRPASVIVYEPGSAESLADRLSEALERLDELRREARAAAPELEDGAELLAGLVEERCRR
jgi:glycosyltransferase involved in cell wall biosynthesis